MPYKTAVFDLDGTLLDTLEDLYLATNAALERHSLPRRQSRRGFQMKGIRYALPNRHF